jgi:hypothetical protein
MNAGGFTGAVVAITGKVTNPTTIMVAYNATATHIKGFYQLNAASAATMG